MRSPEAVAGMLCPVCKTGLAMSERSGIEIDYCPSCRGVWLDRGELDKIIERSEAPEAPAAPQPAPQPNYPPQQPYPPQAPTRGLAAAGIATISIATSAATTRAITGKSGRSRFWRICSIDARLENRLS